VVRRFLMHYGRDRAEEASTELASAIVAFDADTASSAQVMMMGAELDKLEKRLVQAEAEIRHEHRETSMLQHRYDRYVKAAWTLLGRLGKTEDKARLPELESSFAKLIDHLEHLKPEVVAEQNEDRATGKWARDLRLSVDDLAAKLASTAGGNGGRNLAHQRQSGRERGMINVARLTSALSTISVALETMNKETTRIRNARLAAKNEGCGQQNVMLEGDHLAHDPHIAAALNIALPRKRVDGPALRDRLARLGSQPRLTSASAA